MRGKLFVVEPLLWRICCDTLFTHMAEVKRKRFLWEMLLAWAPGIPLMLARKKRAA